MSSGGSSDSPFKSLKLFAHKILQVAGAKPNTLAGLVLQPLLFASEPSTPLANSEPWVGDTKIYYYQDFTIKTYDLGLSF